MNSNKSMEVNNWYKYIDKLETVIHFLECYQLTDDCTTDESETIDNIIKEYEKDINEIKRIVANTVVCVSGLRV